MRNLLLLLLVIIGYLYLRRALRNAAGPARERRQERAPAAAERMVACAHCGVHVPESEAVFNGEVPYCSAEHRLLGPRG